MLQERVEDAQINNPLISVRDLFKDIAFEKKTLFFLHLLFCLDKASHKSTLINGDNRRS